MTWTNYALSELCSFINRGAAPVYIEAGGILVLNQRCVRGERVSFSEARRTDDQERRIASDRMLRPFDILVNSTGAGTLGRVAQLLELPEPATVDSHVTIVRPDPARVLPRYLGFVLRAAQPAIEALAAGSTGQTELNRSHLGSMTIPLPPMDDQTAIVDALGAVEEKLWVNRRRLQTLDEIARNLFASWFVEFEPVRAKARGEAVGLSGELVELFPGGLEDSEIGPVPASWSVSRLGDHIDVVRGLSYKGSGLGAAGVPLHNLNSIYEGGGYKYEGLKFYDGPSQPRHQVCAGDVIVANTEQGHHRLLIGYAALVPQGPVGQALFSHHLYRVRPKATSPLSSSYICQLLNSPRMHGVVSGYANGTTVNMLPVDGLELPLAVIPPTLLVRRFDEIASPSQDRQERLVEENELLLEMLRALLNGLVRPAL